MSCFVQVFGRVRPSANNEEQGLTEVGQNSVRCEGSLGKDPKIYELHRILGQNSTQQEVFNCVGKKIVEECAEGINGTIFAYGQTGSGKTHTMLGPGNSWSDPDSKGIIPRSVEHLFKTLYRKAEECQRFEFTTDVQFVELYNEQIYDLLANSQKPIFLRDTGSEVILDGAEHEIVENYLDLMNVVKRGWESRRTAETMMNRDSSRSHAILIIKIETREFNGNLLTTRYSTLNLVDLAGSERQIHTKASGDRLKEASHINGSLTVLGRCIRELAKRNPKFVAYRDSYLTHILKNSLGGNSRTAVIVNMHPDKRFLSETSSTLQFASACLMIKNTILRNETMSGKQEDAYKEAIKLLRRELDDVRRTAKEEHHKQMEEMEQHWRKAAMETKGQLDEVRAKYRMALVKLNSEDSEFASELVSKTANSETMSYSQFVQEDLLQKLEVMRLELDAKTKECDTVKGDLVEARARVTEHLNESVAFLQTPRTNRRRTRNPRRETLYAPSPDRCAINRPEVADSSQDDNDLLIQIQQLLLDKEQQQQVIDKADLKLCNLMDELVAKENELSKFRKESEHREFNLKESLKEALAENDDLRNKILAGRKELDSLLLKISEKDQLIENANQKRREVEQRLNDELNNLQDQYQDRIAELINQNNSLLQNQESFSDEVKATYENRISDLLAEVEKHKESSDVAKRQSTQKDSSIMSLEQKLTDATNELNAIKESQEQMVVDLEVMRIKYEGAVENEVHWKKNAESLFADRKNLFEEHQKEFELLKKKLRSETEEVVKSLDKERKAHEETRRKLDSTVSNSSKEFTEKMENFRRQFQVEKEKEINERDQQIRNELSQEFRRANRKHEEEVASLNAQVEAYKQLHESDSNAIKSSNGHQNRQQKLSYLDSLRSKLLHSEAEKRKLLEENSRLRKKVEATSDRVLQSRNS